MTLAALLAIAAWQGAHGVYIAAKARLAQHLVLRAWHATRGGASHVRPWPWADTEPVARLVVPGEDVDLVVLAGASGRTLAFGPGHLTGTPLPGDVGNAVVSGHRDTHFSFLAHLKPGDELGVERRDGEWRRYVVTGGEVVDRSDVALLRNTADTRLTLVTCYPFVALRPGGPLRYVVTARLAPPARTPVTRAPVTLDPRSKRAYLSGHEPSDDCGRMGTPEDRAGPARRRLGAGASNRVPVGRRAHAAHRRAWSSRRGGTRAHGSAADPSLRRKEEDHLAENAGRERPDRAM